MYYKNKAITIEITNRCAAKCVMCPREKMIQPLEVMSEKLLKDLPKSFFIFLFLIHLKHSLCDKKSPKNIYCS